MVRTILLLALAFFSSSALGWIGLNGPRFEHGRTSLSEENRLILNELAELTKRYPDYKLVLYGNLGQNEPTDQQLSQQRLAVVEAYLVEQGLDSVRILTEDVGQRWPLRKMDTCPPRTSLQQCDAINIRIDPELLTKVAP